MVDEAQHIHVDVINRTLDFHQILLAHLAAAGVLDDGHGTVQLVQVQIFVNLHALARLDVIQHEALGDTSYA